LRGASLALLDCILVAAVAVAALAVRAHFTRSFDEAVVLESFRASKAAVELGWDGMLLHSVWRLLSGGNGAQLLHEACGARVELGPSEAGEVSVVYGEARALLVCYGAMVELRVMMGVGA